MWHVKKDIGRAKRQLFQALRQGIGDERVLQAMERVPRELFLSPEIRHLAYDDIPLPIGEGQTISQPFVVAMMTSALNLRPTDKVMELGTGSGYQAAILSLLTSQGKIITLERVPKLASAAQRLLQSLDYHNVDVRVASKFLGCQEEVPFDAIIVAAAAPKLPEVLLNQIKIGGRMVIPIGTLKEQELVRVLRTNEGPSLAMLGPCRFVPLIGEDAWPEEEC